MNLKGQVIALSHILYVKPKIFLAEIHFGDQQHFVIVREKSLLSLWQQKLRIRAWVQIRNVHAYKLYEGTKFESQLWELSSLSDIEDFVRPEDYAGHSVDIGSDNLLTYEGRITDDSESSCGYYTLDETVVLCITNMSLVSNLPLFKQGDVVRVYNAHKKRLSGCNLIYACGRTLIVHCNSDVSQNTFPKIPRKVHEDFLQHYALNHCLGIQALSLMRAVRKTLIEKFTTLIPGGILTQKEITKGQPGLLAEVMDQIATVHPVLPQTRSLPREFLCHGKSCSFDNDSSYPSVNCWKLAPEEIQFRCSVLDLWQPQSVLKAADCDKLFWVHEIAEVKPLPNSISFLAGILRVGPTGRWMLQDSFGQIECVFEEETEEFQETRNLEGKIAILTQFTVHKETYSVDNDHFVKVYLSLASRNLRLAALEVVETQERKMVHSSTFTLLHKSSPQILRSTTPAKREILGYFLLASMSSCSASNLAKKARVDEEVSAVTCLLFANGSEAMKVFPFLHRGHSYGLSAGNITDCLEKDTNPVPCLKDLPKDLRNRVFILPHEAVIQVEAAPVRWVSLFKKDILDVEECFQLNITDEVATLRGRIVDRFHVDPKFASEKGGGKFSIEHQTWFGIPGSKKIVVKLGSAKSQFLNPSRVISVYVSLQDGQIYPIGLYPGVTVEVSWISLKNTRDSNRIYGVSTALTRIKILRLEENKPFFPREPTAKTSLGRKFFAEIDSILPGELFSCVVTVRFINKVSMKAVCTGCGSPVISGRCSYVGCHWSGQPKIEMKAWCTVEDGSGRAVMYMHGDVCRQWLNLPQKTWSLIENFVTHKGELFYPNSRMPTGDSRNAIDNLFELFFKTSSSLLGPFTARVRKFRASKEGDAGKIIEPYFLRDLPTRRLFCLDIHQLDPAQSATELLLT